MAELQWRWRPLFHERGTLPQSCSGQGSSRAICAMADRSLDDARTESSSLLCSAAVFLKAAAASAFAIPAILGARADGAA